MIESALPVYYEDFIQSLLDIGVKEAIYLDMGAKSSYSQYRNNEGKVTDLFGPVPGMFIHTWVAFIK